MSTSDIFFAELWQHYCEAEKAAEQAQTALDGARRASQDTSVLESRAEAAWGQYRYMEQSILDTPAESIVGIAYKLRVWKSRIGLLELQPNRTQEPVVKALNDAERLAGLADFGPHCATDKGKAARPVTAK